MAPWNKGKSACLDWLHSHANFTGRNCLIWPFATQPSGYGQFGIQGRNYYAHRYMCELVNGPPPSPKHQAAHSCGKGHDGCTHPLHLSWKTVSENLLDRRRHGTVEYGCRWTPKLTFQQVMQIRRLKGKKTQQQIADQFGVKRPCIQYWHRTNHRPTIDT